MRNSDEERWGDSDLEREKKFWNLEVVLKANFGFTIGLWSKHSLRKRLGWLVNFMKILWHSVKILEAVLKGSLGGHFVLTMKNFRILH